MKKMIHPALVSMDEDFDSKPPSKGVKLFIFTIAKTGKLRKFLDDKLDEMFQVDPKQGGRYGR